MDNINTIKDLGIVPSTFSRSKLHFCRMICTITSIIITLAIISPSVLISDEEVTSDTTSTEMSNITDLDKQNTVLLDAKPVDAPEIDGTAYLLYDAQSQTFLIGNNYDTPLPPASITKVLTILLAFENLDLDDTITVTKDMYDYIPESYVRLGIVEGEELNVMDAMYASLLISANDACSALAVKMGGTVDGFSKMMNERALELGCTGTHFTNPFGYSDPTHLTTAHDMILIMEAALEYDLFKKITTTSSYTIPTTNKYSDTRVINNGNRFISTTTYSYEHYIAGKTGYTDLSGHTIVAAAEKDGRILIGVIFGASHSEIRYQNLIDLFNYGFSEYTTSSNDASEYISIQEQTCGQIDASIETAGLVVSKSEIDLKGYITTLSQMASGGYSTSIDLSGVLVAPNVDIQELILPINRQYSDGTVLQVGTLLVTISSDTITEENVETISEKDGFLASNIVPIVIVLSLLIVMFVCLIIFLSYQKKRKSRMNRRKPRIL